MKRLPDALRSQLIAELVARERYTIKAIARRHKVSRQTLARLRAEMLRERALSHSDSIVILTQQHTEHHS